METTYFDKLKTNILVSCGRVNDYADEKDASRNSTNYGMAIAFASVVRDMGHSVEIPVWEDDGFLRVPKLVIDGKTVLEYRNGK